MCICRDGWDGVSCHVMSCAVMSCDISPFSLAKLRLRYDHVYLLLIRPNSQSLPPFTTLLTSPTFLTNYRTLLQSRTALPIHVHVIWCMSQWHAAVKIIQICQYTANESITWGQVCHMSITCHLFGLVMICHVM